MADSGGKEHNVVIANCSREWRALPLDVDLWVHFVPDFCGAVCRAREHNIFHSLCRISKADLGFVGCVCDILSAGQCMWPFYFRILMIHYMLGD